MNANSSERLVRTPCARFVIEILVAIASLFLWTGDYRLSDSSASAAVISSLPSAPAEFMASPSILPAY